MGPAAWQCRRPAILRREPTIGKAINGGFDLLEAKCNRCDRVSLLSLWALRQPPDTPVWKLEATSLLRAMQRRPALQPAAAGAYSWVDVRAAGSRAEPAQNTQMKNAVGYVLNDYHSFPCGRCRKDGE